MVRYAPLALVLSLALSHASTAGEPPEYIKEYAKASQLQRFQAIAEAQQQTSAIRDNTQRAIELGQSKREALASAQAAIANSKAYAAKLADPQEPYYATVPVQTLKVGSIGRLNCIDASVFQIIDKNNMLVELGWQASVTKYLNSAEAATEENVYEGSERRTLLVWVRGIDTSGLVTGKGLAFQGVHPDGVFAVRKAQTYETLSGSKSVPVLEEVDIAPWSHHFTMCGEMRTWHGKSGKHSIEAAFVDYKAGSVNLVGADGKSRKLKLNDLSDEDQEYVREQMRIRRKMLLAARK